VADFCRMVIPEPVVRQIIGKLIETVGRTVKTDPLRTLATVRYRDSDLPQTNSRGTVYRRHTASDEKHRRNLLHDVAVNAAHN
jgi:hypothetical protein